MLTFLKKYIDINLIKISFLFAIIHCLLFNSAIYNNKFHHISSSIVTAIIELVKDFTFDLATLFVIFFSLTVFRSLFIGSSVFLFITGALASYYLYFFSISPTLSMMPSIYGTNLTEINELVSARLIVWLVFSASICLYSINHFKVQVSKLYFNKLLSSICLVIVISNIISPKFGYMKTSFPIQYLHNSYKYFFGSAKDHARLDISLKYSFNDLSDEDVIGVLVIGEAARYSNFGINGYERDTTPNLEKIENLYSFKTRSCASTTFLSVPCMLSRFSEKDINQVHSETSFLSILSKLDFETIWLGSQLITKYYKRREGGSFYDEVKFHLIPGGSIAMLPNSLDEKILPYFEQHISSKNKKFIVLHTTGSHWNYSERYTKAFAKFQPDIKQNIKIDSASCDPQERLNSYDNSILYTDFFLSSVIELLKNKNAFVIYSADHGESLGEGGILTHGSSEYVIEQREVPLIIWFSDSYKNAHPEKFQAIKLHEKKELSHDYIFHSVLDCLNIESSIIDKSLSLCQY